MRNSFVDDDGHQHITCDVDATEASDGAAACEGAAAGEDAPTRQGAGGRDGNSPATLTIAQLSAGVAVGEAMARRVVCVDQDTSVRLTQQAMAAEGAVALAVVSAAGELVGIVERKKLAPVPPIALPISMAGIVDPPATALNESEPLRAAVTALTTERARWLPVVNAGGTLIGVINDLDVLRWMVRARGSPT